MTRFNLRHFCQSLIDGGCICGHPFIPVATAQLQFLNNYTNPIPLVTGYAHTLHHPHHHHLRHTLHPLTRANSRLETEKGPLVSSPLVQWAIPFFLFPSSFPFVGQVICLRKGPMILAVDIGQLQLQIPVNTHLYYTFNAIVHIFYFTLVSKYFVGFLCKTLGQSLAPLFILQLAHVAMLPITRNCCLSPLVSQGIPSFELSFLDQHRPGFESLVGIHIGQCICPRQQICHPIFWGRKEQNCRKLTLCYI